MILKCPTIREAMKIWLDGMQYRIEHDGLPLKDEYIFHTQGIAFHSRLLATHIPELDPEKAYIAGLLHDYGKKYDERKTMVFHGLVGYEELTAMGFDFPARICLTHSFPEKDFQLSDFPSYRETDLLRAKQILADLNYDDYDLIVQFVDKLFEGLTVVPYEERTKGLTLRYNLSDRIVKNLIKSGDVLKEYLSCRCNKDVYDIIGLNAHI